MEDCEKAVKLMLTPTDYGPYPLCYVGSKPIYSWKDLEETLDQCQLETLKRRNHDRKR